MLKSIVEVCSRTRWVIEPALLALSAESRERARLEQWINLNLVLGGSWR
jgi:hypothetical protein